MNPSRDKSHQSIEKLNQQLDRLRQYRVRPERDLSLDVQAYFKRNIAKPHQQIGRIAEVWRQLLPPELSAHTRLESLTKGVLRVEVDSSAHLYELDRQLRSGLGQQILAAHQGSSLKRIQLRLADPGQRVNHEK